MVCSSCCFAIFAAATIADAAAVPAAGIVVMSLPQVLIVFTATVALLEVPRVVEVQVCR